MDDDYAADAVPEDGVLPTDAGVLCQRMQTRFRRTALFPWMRFVIMPGSLLLSVTTLRKVLKGKRCV